MNYSNFLKILENFTKKLNPYELSNLDFLWRTNIDAQIGINNKENCEITYPYKLIKKLDILEILKLKGVIKNSYNTNLKLLGSGCYSYAYELDDYKVLKITFDKKTAEMHQWILNNQNNQIIKKYIANVYQIGYYKFSNPNKLKLVSSFNSKTTIKGFYFIITEKLKPIERNKFNKTYNKFIQEFTDKSNPNKLNYSKLHNYLINNYELDKEEYKLYYSIFKSLTKNIFINSNGNLFSLIKLLALSKNGYIHLTDNEYEIVEDFFYYLINQSDELDILENILIIYDKLSQEGFIMKDMHIEQFGLDKNNNIKFYEFDGKLLNNKKTEIKTILYENN